MQSGPRTSWFVRAFRRAVSTTNSVNTSKLQEQIEAATPDQNWKNEEDKFYEVVKSIQLGSDEANVVLSLLQQRLSGNPKWMEAFKCLQLLDYLLHLAYSQVFPWAKNNVKEIEGSLVAGEDEHAQRRITYQFYTIKWLLSGNKQIHNERESAQLSWMGRVMSMPKNQLLSNPVPNSLDAEHEKRNQSSSSASASSSDKIAFKPPERPKTSREPAVEPQTHSLTQVATRRRSSRNESITQVQQDTLIDLCEDVQQKVLKEAHRMLVSCRHVLSFCYHNERDFRPYLSTKTNWKASLDRLSKMDLIRLNMSENTLHERLYQIEKIPQLGMGNDTVLKLLEDSKATLTAVYQHFETAFVKETYNRLRFVDEDRKIAWRSVLACQADQTTFDLKAKMEEIWKLLPNADYDTKEYRRLDRTVDCAFMMRKICLDFKTVIGPSNNEDKEKTSETPSSQRLHGLSLPNTNPEANETAAQNDTEDLIPWEHPHASPKTDPVVTTSFAKETPTSPQTSSYVQLGLLSSSYLLIRNEKNLIGTGLSFLDEEQMYNLYSIFEDVAGRHAVTISKRKTLYVLRLSRLNEHLLPQIWELCDMEKLGKLFFPEFALAFYFMNLVAMQKKPLPIELPEDLRNEVWRQVGRDFDDYRPPELLPRTSTPFSETEKTVVDLPPQDSESGDESHGDSFSILSPFSQGMRMDEMDEETKQQLDKTQKPRSRALKSPPPRENPMFAFPEDRISQTAGYSPRTAPTETTTALKPLTLSSALSKPYGRKVVSIPSSGSKSRRLAVSDLILDSKLETVIGRNGAVVQHISYESNPRNRRLRREETWKRIRRLGSGAFGCVWLEECLDGGDKGKLRAVKQIAKMPPQNSHGEISYNRELEAIAKFSHSKYVHCFVRSFGWYESNQTIFITMEYLEKGDLQIYLTKPFPEGEVKQIIFQILEGLAFMHKNGFAHRDLKPANILVSELSPNWWVKISDFGISKRAEEEATEFRTLVGTRGYLAPEVLGIYSPDDVKEGIPGGDDWLSSYTVAIDIWALGAIMLKLLTNKNIFEIPRQLALYVTVKQPFPESDISKCSVSGPCMRFLRTCMARSPADRPSSSHALEHIWFSDLHYPTAMADIPLKRLSLTPGFPGQEYTTNGTNDTLPSAEWPSTTSMSGSVTDSVFNFNHNSSWIHLA